MDTASVLEQYTQDLSNLPAELAHLLSELGDKDMKYYETRKRLQQRDNQLHKYIKQFGSLAKNPKEPQIYSKINEDFDKAFKLQEEKCILANTALFSISKYLTKLENDIKTLENEGLLAPLELLEQETALTSAMSSINNLNLSSQQKTHKRQPSSRKHTHQSQSPLPLSQQSTSTAASTSHHHRSQSSAATSRNNTPGASASSYASLARPSSGFASGSNGGATLASSSSSPQSQQNHHNHNHHQLNQQPKRSALNSDEDEDGDLIMTDSDLVSRRKTNGPQPPNVVLLSSLHASSNDVQITGPVAGSSTTATTNTGEEDELYCFCRQVSFGNMIACDNSNCKYEWFHYDCVGLKEPPQGTWYCPDCAKIMGVGGNGNGTTKNRKKKHQLQQQPLQQLVL